MGIKEDIATLRRKRRDLVKQLNSIYDTVESNESNVEVANTRKMIRALSRGIAEIDVQIDLLKNLKPVEEETVTEAPLKK